MWYEFYPGFDLLHIKKSVKMVQAAHVSLEACLGRILKQYKRIDRSNLLVTPAAI